MIDIGELISSNRKGQATGLPCFCTANEQVLRTILKFAAKTGFPTIIEATCNQVNQDGGYTGLNPEGFMSWITELANDYAVPMDQLILGGDHLGPNPWRSEDAEIAMAKAEDLVRSYAKAGFRKIHLDASMACGGEPVPTFELVAKRAARLCKIAEESAPNPENLIYIIGTEVPIPGGESDDMDELEVTSPDSLAKTIETHMAAFADARLSKAFERVVSIVTQPGVDFSHEAIYPFAPKKAEILSRSILQYPGLTFEAHSTDYQATESLSELVAMHFFFLKVGPEITFKFREAILALSHIEERLKCADPSNIKAVLKRVMDQNPADWQHYYRESEGDISLLQDFSYSDRVRYYWPHPEITEALDKLYRNIRSQRISDGLVSQYFPLSRFGKISSDPEHLVDKLVEISVARYFSACGFNG